MTEVAEKAKPGPKPKPKAPTGGAPMVIAVHRINGDVLPNTPLIPASAAQYDELLALEAVRLPTESEIALYEKSPESIVRLDGDADPADVFN